MTKSLNSDPVNSAVAVLGGTFDPVHHGHLQLAIDVAERLNLTQVRLMPSFQPVHRSNTTATSEQRLKMLQLAVADSSKLVVDDREFRRQGASYTLLSLEEIRAEIGNETPLFFIMGEDAFSQFDSWHQWQKLVDYAHILVAIRPGKHPKISATLARFADLHGYTGESVPTSAAGNIIWMDNVVLEISSSDIRQRIAEQRNLSYLLPLKVIDYIEQQQIYR